MRPFTRFTDELLDDATRLLEQQGMTLTEAATALGIRHACDNLSKHLRARGVQTRRRVYRPSSTAKDYPRDMVVLLYADGWSVKKLSERFGVCRATIRAQLVRDGVEPRNRSEGMITRWQTMTTEEREQLGRAKSAALRGIRRTEESKVDRAKRKPAKIGAGEKIIAEALRARGIEFEAQAPIYIYNIDLLVGAVAVEPHQRGGNPLDGKHCRQRTEELLRRGIATLWIIYNHIDDLIGCLEYVIADLNLMRRQPPAVRQYRVVRCCSDRYSRRRRKMDQRAIEPTPLHFYYYRVT